MMRSQRQPCIACLVLVIAPPLLLVLGSAAWAQASGDPTATPAAAVAGGPPPCSSTACVSAEPEAGAAPKAAPFVVPTPRLDLSLTSFAIGNGGAATVPLTGLELDLHALSTPWLRGGLTLAAGRGHGAISGADVGVRYGLVGLSLALQFPARVSPFIQGNLAGGLLAGNLDGALSIPGTSVSLTGGSAATWIYTRGADLGVQLYAFGSLHLTASVGWVRATWRDLDTAAMVAARSTTLRFKDVTNDSFVSKIGVGF